MRRIICPVYPTIQPTSSTRRIPMGDYDPKETEENEVPVGPLEAAEVPVEEKQRWNKQIRQCDLHIMQEGVFVSPEHLEFKVSYQRQALICFSFTSNIL